MQARSGFTLVELLVVVAILGILATLALPRLQATRERALASGMVADLRHLVTAQENYFVTYQDYANQIAPVEVAGPGTKGRVALVLSPGNTLAITRRAPTAANGSGWSAVMSNPGVTNAKFNNCGVYVGHKSYAPNKAVVAEGAVACY